MDPEEVIYRIGFANVALEAHLFFIYEGDIQSYFISKDILKIRG